MLLELVLDAELTLDEDELLELELLTTGGLQALIASIVPESNIINNGNERLFLMIIPPLRGVESRGENQQRTNHSTNETAAPKRDSG